MSDTTPTPAESPAPDAEPSQTEVQKRKSHRTLIGWLIALVVIAIIVLALLWLRGCGRTPSSGQPASKSSTSSAGESGLVIDNRVHAALHAKMLPNGERLDNYVYIFEVSTADRVAVAITLTPVPVRPGMNPKTIAADCENAVLAGVPEVTTVAVVDANHAPISAQTRR